MRSTLLALVAFGLLAAHAAAALAQEQDQDKPQRKGARHSIFNPETRMPQTLGGVYLWSDEVIFRGWKIQRHAALPKYRLIDPDNVQHAFGNFPYVREKFEAIKRRRDLAPLDGKVVVLLHGLSSNYRVMQPLADYLEAEGGYTVINMNYPSTLGGVGRHAQSLANVVKNLGDEVDEIDFVGHSMGNLVVRHYLADQTDPEKGLSPDPRLERFVMIAPPNHGVQVIQDVEDVDLTRIMTGIAGKQLGTGFAELEKRLAVPDFSFGIIAGSWETDEGLNPVIPGDDDGLVSVDTTRLEGSADFVTVKGAHFFLPRNRQVMQYVLNFLENGSFSVEQE